MRNDSRSCPTLWQLCFTFPCSISVVATMNYELQLTIFSLPSANIWITMADLSCLRNVSFHPHIHKTSSTNDTLVAAFVPGFPEPFVVALSEKLAPHAPELTLDFITAVASMYKTSVSQKISCLQYLSPWVRNFPRFLDPTNDLFEPSGTKFRDCVRQLIDLTFSDTEVSIIYLLRFLAYIVCSRFMLFCKSTFGERSVGFRVTWSMLS